MPCRIRRVEPVGAVQSQDVDVRIVAATNRDLGTAVAAGAFRQDLLYRLNGCPIVLPPLRDRHGDVLLLAEHFVRQFAKDLHRVAPAITRDAALALEKYDWPGNIRELEHMIHRALVLSDEAVIDLYHLPISETTTHSVVLANRAFQTLEDYEREYIEKVLDHTAGRVQGPKGAARILGVNPSTLRSRLRKLGLS